MSDFRERPNSIPWPPILFAGAALVALGLQALVPLPWPDGAWRAALAMAGLFLVAAGLALDLATMLAFRHHRTTVLPHRGATRLITDGPFRFSRNPIYVGNTLLVAGAGLAFGVAWLIPAALAGAFATSRLAIAREEQHLALRFGKGTGQIMPRARHAGCSEAWPWDDGPAAAPGLVFFTDNGSLSA